MTIIANDNCARCKHFKMKEYPEHARVGLGRCTGYPKGQELINPFLPWSTKPCARFDRAADVVVRQEWIDKQRAKQEKKQTPTEA
jgi:hypothetical protein